MNSRILHFKNYEKYKFSKRHARRFKPDDDMGIDWIAWYSRRTLSKIFAGDPVKKVYFELDEVGVFCGLLSIAHALGRPEGYLACNKYTPYTPLAMAEFMHRAGAHGVVDIDRLQSSIKTIERTIEKLLIVSTLEWVESDTLSASEDTMSAKEDATKRIGKDKQERKIYEDVLWQYKYSIKIHESTKRKYIEPLKASALEGKDLEERLQKWSGELDTLVERLKKAKFKPTVTEIEQEVKRVVEFVIADYYPEKRKDAKDWIGWAKHVLHPLYLWSKWGKIYAAYELKKPKRRGVTKSFTEKL